MDKKIKVDLLVRGNLTYVDYVTCASEGHVLYCVSQDQLDDRCDISGAIVVDGDMHVDRIDAVSYTHLRAHETS